MPAEIFVSFRISTKERVIKMSFITIKGNETQLSSIKGGILCVLSLQMTIEIGNAFCFSIT